MISVQEALDRILKTFAPLPAETVSVAEAFGRVLAADLTARVTQPPHAVSAMDG
jgi:molybdopterin molybdotransferase